MMAAVLVLDVNDIDQSCDGYEAPDHPGSRRRGWFFNNLAELGGLCPSHEQE